tara:strand:+ start:3080 stop:3568 length:489 start_codon:yes stop_codon:yes gene_type:complete
MIKCNKCGYNVPSELKYAIMNNLCPSCGDVLFGDSDMVAINSISQSILHQDFSEGMNKVLVNDIALFIFNEYSNNAVSATDESTKDAESPEHIGVDDQSRSGDPNSLSENLLEKIRDEVRVEALTEAEDYEEDEDRKIARLKRLAKEAGLKNNRGTIVKRVT